MCGLTGEHYKVVMLCGSILPRAHYDESISILIHFFFFFFHFVAVLVVSPASQIEITNLKIIQNSFSRKQKQ